MPESITKCFNCEVEKTPMWRRTLDAKTDKLITLCNACGLYYKSKGSHRPNLLISKKNLITTSQLLDKITQDRQLSLSSDDPLSVSLPRVIDNEQDIKITDLKIITCSNCTNINTSIWRKDENGKNICNACGLYYKKKGVHRVVKNKSKKDDVFFKLDQGNMLRFNVIKRRKRSSSSSSSGGSTSGSVDKKEKSPSAAPTLVSSDESLTRRNSSPTTPQLSYLLPIATNSSSSINEIPSAPLRRNSTDITQYHYSNESPPPQPPLLNYSSPFYFSNASALSYLSALAAESKTSLDSQAGIVNQEISDGKRVSLPSISSLLNI